MLLGVPCQYKMWNILQYNPNVKSKVIHFWVPMTMDTKKREEVHYFHNMLYYCCDA